MFNKFKRYPENADPSLRAWDAADELLISEFSAYSKSLDLKLILIIGDSFGALTLKLHEYNLDVYTDSYVSSLGIQNNVKGDYNLLHDLESLESSYDLVILKVPKNMSYLEDILIKLSNILKKDTPIVSGSMVKHLPKTAFDHLNKYIGETTTSLAKKKARLIYSKIEKEAASSPYPIKLEIPEWDKALVNHSNLFSREKLDIGTRFFLEHIPSGIVGNILDLGCANGIVGLAAKKANPVSKIIYTDDSFMAVKSAQANFEASFNTDDSKSIWMNCYEDPELPKVELVLCNPPFHQGNTIGDFIAWQMFQDSKRALNTGGKIRIIGNSHLGYHIKLKKIFGNVTTIAQNKKFIILESTKES